jgi:uncharacterized repeat protein (TIGR01451 family)
MRRLLFAFTALAVAAIPSIAAAEVSLSSNVFVERQVTDQSGKASIKLEEPGVVTPGDKLVFSVAYANKTKIPATDFVVTNPLPSSVVFAGEESAGAELSVDGGGTWGSLPQLKVNAPDGGQRAASASDVTHVRWAFPKPIAPGAEGKLSFRAVVK